MNTQPENIYGEGLNNHGTDANLQNSKAQDKLTHPRLEDDWPLWDNPEVKGGWG